MSSLATNNNRKGGASPTTGAEDRPSSKAPTKFQEEAGDGEGEESDDEEGGGAGKGSKKAVHRKIKIEYIDDKSRRHITFSKRKAGIMKKAYELSTLTGTQVLLLVVSETGLVYTFTTPKLQPLVTKPEGKNLIQACLNAPDAPTGNTESSPSAQPQQPQRPPQQQQQQPQNAYPDQLDPSDPMYGEDRKQQQHASTGYNPALMGYPASYGGIPSAMPMGQNYMYGSNYGSQHLYGSATGQYVHGAPAYPAGWGSTPAGTAAGGMAKFAGQGGGEKK